MTLRSLFLNFLRRGSGERSYRETMRDCISLDGNRSNWIERERRLNVRLKYLGVTECFLAAEKKTFAGANNQHVLPPRMMLWHEE